LEGASEIITGQQGELVVTLLSGDGVGIPNEWINISSLAGNQITFSSQLTDPSGQITLTVGSDAGDDVISFNALSQTVSGSHQLAVVDSEQSVSTPVKIRVISNASVIETGGSDTATITALVTDEDNRVIEGHQVEFSSTQQHQCCRAGYCRTESGRRLSQSANHRFCRFRRTGR